MELQDFVKLHEMKAKAARIYDKNRNDVRTSVSYTAEEHEELVSMLKELEKSRRELQRYRERDAAREKEAMEVLDYLKNGPDIPKEPFSFPNNEVMVSAMKLQSCFRGSTFLVDREPIEFLADEKSNTYFILGDCETKEDVDCKVIERLSRAAYKTEPYYSDVSNRKFHARMMDGINKYLGTNFTKEDIEIIYTYLGNACNHEKTLEFVRSGFDMDVLLEKSEDFEK